ncbi:MAG: YtxH domain-containing protein, partial [Staphylococcus aureus]
MKASRILFGIGVGVAAGFVVALQGRDDKSVKNNTIDRTA